jgi:hypothetical protein
MKAERRSLPIGRGFGLPSATARVILGLLKRERRASAMTTFFKHYRQRGPVNALQMRLQG